MASSRAAVKVLRDNGRIVNVGPPDRAPAAAA
jgi:hypothetical protein